MVAAGAACELVENFSVWIDGEGPALLEWIALYLALSKAGAERADHVSDGSQIKCAGDVLPHARRLERDSLRV